MTLKIGSVAKFSRELHDCTERGSVAKFELSPGLGSLVGNTQKLF